MNPIQLRYITIARKEKLHLTTGSVQRLSHRLSHRLSTTIPCVTRLWEGTCALVLHNIFLVRALLLLTGIVALVSISDSNREFDNPQTVSEPTQCVVRGQGGGGQL